LKVNGFGKDLERFGVKEKGKKMMKEGEDSGSGSGIGVAFLRRGKLERLSIEFGKIWCEEKRKEDDERKEKTVAMAQNMGKFE